MIKKIKQILETPNRKYGMYPIIHQRILQPELVNELDEAGFGGVVGNIDYRPDFDDSDAVWEETAKSMRTYIGKGMHVWIYDEDGYPSGSASGYLTEKYPEHIAKALYCYEYWKVLGGPCQYRSAIPDGELYRAVLVNENGQDIIDVSDTLNENRILRFDIPTGNFKLIIMVIRRLFDGAHCSESWAAPRDYINIFDEDACGKFIQMTHEKYKKQIGDEFGKGIIATFTDEPSLTAWYILKDGLYPYLLWDKSFPEKFYKKYGYDFLYACVAVLKEHMQNSTKVRCDYWEFIADATANAFFKQIGDWCKTNNLKSSGHFLGEELLSVHVLGYGSFYRCMKHLDIPGIDMLDCEPEKLMDTTKIPVGRFVASFADISGENEVFTELSELYYRISKGIAGIEYYYGSVNWHLALGINNFTSYFSFNGITPAEKKRLNKYVARCGEIMRMGVRDSHTAVFYPEYDMWAKFNVTPKDGHTVTAGGNAFSKIQKDFSAVSWWLLNRQVDFDYVDSDLIFYGSIQDGMLCYNGRCYHDIIYPAFSVVSDRMAERIIALSEAGIRVHILTGNCEISRDTGDASSYAQKIAALIAQGNIFHCKGDVEQLENRFTGMTIKTGTLRKNLLTHCRITEDKCRIIFAANMDREALCDQMEVTCPCSTVYLVNAEDGSMRILESVKTSDRIRFPIEIDAMNANIYILV